MAVTSRRGFLAALFVAPLAPKLARRVAENPYARLARTTYPLLRANLHAPPAFLTEVKMIAAMKGRQWMSAPWHDERDGES